MLGTSGQQPHCAGEGEPGEQLGEPGIQFRQLIEAVHEHPERWCGSLGVFRLERSYSLQAGPKVLLQLLYGQWSGWQRTSGPLQRLPGEERLLQQPQEGLAAVAGISAPEPVEEDPLLVGGAVAVVSYQAHHQHGLAHARSSLDPAKPPRL